MNKDAFVNAFFSGFSFEPTADQQHAVQLLAAFLAEGSEREVFLLRGYAGTGKTRIIAELSQTLPAFKMRSVLLAPTGRAAKVLAGYAKGSAQTIHRKIYRKETSPEGGMVFSQAPNQHKNSLFIVDEASMIGESGAGEGASFNNLLGDLLEYVFSGENCRLMLVGDTAQLPPVGSALSPALDKKYLQSRYSLIVKEAELKQVVRQKEMSGILFNATGLRVQLLENENKFPKLETGTDVLKITGMELEDALNEAYSNFGYEEVLVICRSNKRANAYNQQIRVRIKWQENELSTGDLMMVVKNNYFWLDEKSEAGFIANGDGIELKKVRRIKEVYGFRFAEVLFRLADYPNEPDMDGILLLDTLMAESPALTQQQSKQLFDAVMEDFADEPIKGRRYALLRKNPYYNALQVKFSYAVTCHKAQGGQWPCIFIDQGYFTEDMMNAEYLRWLYTAFTRATEKVYLVNFNERFFEETIAV